MSRRTLLVLIVLLGGLPILAFGMDRETLRWVRNKPIIKEIVIEGNNYLSDGDVIEAMYSVETGFWRSIKGDRRRRVQRESFGRDTLEIKYLYWTNGFLGVRVDETFEPLLPDSTARVVVTIDEGRQYVYGPTDVEGEFVDWYAGFFRRVVARLEPGDPVNPVHLRQAVFEMAERLANSGYPYARVNYDLDTTSTPPMTPVKFTVEPGPLVHFGEVFVFGTERFPRRVALRELRFQPGDLYRQRLITQSRRRLFESGYFSYLQLLRDTTGTDSLRWDFDLIVRERKPYYVTITTGIGQSEVRDLQYDFSAGFGKRNFLGSRKVDLTAEYSLEARESPGLIAHRYRLRYTEPWLLGIRMPLAITGELNPEIKSPVQDYKIGSWAVSAETNRRFGDRVVAIAGVEYERVQISGVPEAAADSLRAEEGISVRRRLYGSFVRDARNDVFLPKRGTLLDLSAEYFGGFLGGDDDFYKLEGAFSVYFRIWPGWVSATRIMGGSVQEFGDTRDIPSDELLYLGGANTVRSFRENLLGPLRDDGSAEGAQVSVVFNQEFRWPLLTVLGFPIWQSLFVDVGNGFRKTSDISTDALAVAYGAGIQLVSPAGPIRVDYARRVPTERFAFDDRLHFTILYAF